MVYISFASAITDVPTVAQYVTLKEKRNYVHKVYIAALKNTVGNVLPLEPIVLELADRIWSMSFIA